MASRVRQLIAHDRWTAMSAEHGSGSYILRFRIPVLQPNEVEGYSRCLRVVWAYDDEGKAALPSADASARMATFENRLCAAWERDGLAALAAVLTFDGARQWVFYTADSEACGVRLADMPQESDRYPIELDVFDDPTWQYVRDEIIRESHRRGHAR